MSQPAEPGPRTHFRTCPICEATCGLAIEVEAGRVKKIRGDEDDVFSRGYVCPKGASLRDLHEDPDRLRAPLVRREGRLVEASWDEAFAAVEAGLARVRETHGDDAVGVYLGNPNAHNYESGLYMRPLLKSLGTHNIYSASTVDQIPRHVSSGLLYGGPGLIPVPDIDRTQYLLMLGANPYESNGSLCTAPDWPGRMKAIRARGGRIVVVDPRRTRTADNADEHLAIRPGADVFFLLALAHVLVEHGAPGLGALGEHVEGLEDLCAALAPLRPEAVAARTGIEAATIRRIAGELAAAQSGVVYGRIGVHTVEFGTLSSWATDVVTLLAGHFDRPGGLLFNLPAHARADSGRPGGRGFTTGRFRSRVRGLPEVMGELPVATLADEIETPGEGRIRALLTIAGNPVLSTPNGARLDHALGTLDFMVSVDIYLNETTRHADVILPPPSPLERGHYDLGLYSLAVRQVANWSPPLFEAGGPAEHAIFAKLALIAQGKGADADPALVDELLVRGLAEAAVASEGSALHGQDVEAVIDSGRGRSGPERVLDLMLRAGAYGDRLSLDALEQSPHGIDLGPLAPRVPAVLRTPSGKIELMAPAIRDELSRATASIRETRKSGLVLVGRRHVRSNNSWLHNVERLVRGKPRCTLQMHPDDAAAAGVAAGDRVRVRSRVGELVAPVEVTDAIRPGVVSLPHGWGHDMEGVSLSVARQHAGVNSNLLTDEEAMDVPSGNAVLNGIPVEVRPV
jgi:anaerobic selenocysteine-containing dehydrogenase